MSQQQSAPWHQTSDERGIVYLSLDLPNSSTNVVSFDVIDSLANCLQSLVNDPPKGLIIRSAKDNGFIAGADINAFTELDNPDDTLAAINNVHKVLNCLEQLSCPTVAVIHGYCLGGGLELALACDYRLAVDDDRCRIGLPEVKLGIHPGYGGSVRLIEKIGVLPAMEMILSGRDLSAKAARKLGVIDDALAERYIIKRAREYIDKQPNRREASLLQRLLSWRLFRPIIARFLCYLTSKKVKETDYPSPYAMIKLWQQYADDRKRFLQEEALSVAKLIHTATAQHLVRLFFLRQRLKSFAKGSSFTANHVHVVGAGIMGGDIAAWCALKGLDVTLQDQSFERVAPAIKRASQLFKRQLKDKVKVRAALDRLSPDIQGHGISRADVVIEAIFEDLDAKQSLLKTIEPQLKPGALLATNTSSIPLEKLTEGLEQAERLVGLHFFNPVAKMQLIEVVSSKQTSPSIANDAASFSCQISRLPLPVKSAPGFLVNRVLMPYLLEAVNMVEEHIDIDLIDKVALDFGMPMGPIELADSVGLDICLSVAGMLSEALAVEVPDVLQTLVAEKNLGRKTGQGFYHYRNGKKEKPFIKGSTTIDESLIEQRLIYRLINECVSCLDEEVVADMDLIDAAMVFGTGFAPFRGGPMTYLNQQSDDKVFKQLEKMAVDIDARFSPKSGWENQIWDKFQSKKHAI